MTKREELRQIWETGGISGQEAMLSFLQQVYADLLTTNKETAKKFNDFIKKWHQGKVSIELLLDIADAYRGLNNRRIEVNEFVNLLTPLLS